MYLHNDTELFSDMLSLVNQKSGISLAVLEKDYYVTMLLKLLSERSDRCVFKGGTSLSKCFRVLNRFSEDIDITFSEHLGEGRRKALKYKILLPISEELGLKISNWDKIESDKDYNSYIFSYEPIDGYVEESLYPGVKLETSLGSYSFPTERKEVTNYIYEYLKEEEARLLWEYGLTPFSMQIQSLDRTFIDKVFALCDYYMQGKSDRCSRHLYDLYKLKPLVKFDEEFRRLIKDVREHRASLKLNCPSSKPGIDIGEIIREFCENDFYYDDYQKITSYFTNEPVAYRDTIKNILVLSELKLFD